MGNQWYVEEAADGWHLNESIPDASDGWLATFGAAQGEQAQQAAREHNAHADLLAAMVACEDALVREGSAKAWTAIEVARAAIAKARG